MAVYTKLDKEKLNAILSNYNLGEIKIISLEEINDDDRTRGTTTSSDGSGTKEYTKEEVQSRRGKIRFQF